MMVVTRQSTATQEVCLYAANESWSMVAECVYTSLVQNLLHTLFLKLSSTISHIDISDQYWKRIVSDKVLRINRKFSYYRY